MLREQDKHFLWSLLAAVGVVLVWKGLWEGMREIPYAGDPWVLFFIGFAMLTFSGMIFKEFDPLGSIDKSIKKVFNQIRVNPNKKDFEIKYFDKVKKKEIIIHAEKIKHLEKGYLVVEHQTGKQEVFIPTHRLTEVMYKGKKYWQL